MEEIDSTNARLLPTDTRIHRSDEEKQKHCEYALQHMESGTSLNAVAIELGINPGTLLTWLRADLELEKRYENSKIVRARALFEAALAEMQESSDWKRAEARARLYLRFAALLNPAEFSERAQVNAGKNMGVAKSVSFTLNFTQPSSDRGELTVIAQPDGGELP
jgi:hypothetical protein